ncbi:ABC transporter permease subunit [Ensifer sp.]|jgi:general L-amino acid transport system permease protein|uniref:ABC transporter permease subunit n=1 Tax=Ensifer sp. TaxID=1872086 RepID=UPI002E0F82C1|nr:ABC transporter permease subunit [Ensifer sp.]HEV7307491.1 ABC transporter permease subunit [Ensifer sp.]
MPPFLTPQPAPKLPSRISWMDLAAALALALVLVLVAFNIYANMATAGIQPGFSFLTQQAGFDLSESLIAYGASDSYLRAITAGLLNTIAVAVASLAVACAVGLLVGLLSVSASRPARMLAHAYVEVFRNLPKILVLLVIFVAAVNGLPAIRQAITLGPLTISNRAIYFPWLAEDPRNSRWLIACLVAVPAACALWMGHVSRRQARDGVRGTVIPMLLAFSVIIPTGLAVVLGAPLGLSTPSLEGFSINGGAAFSIQFCTVAVALGLYHGAQIAEVLRGGIEAVPIGQIEAAAALGLKRGRITRLVVLPQVMRTVIPPLNNQFVNLLKNTSISIAVGYSDLMSVAGTTINQTFRPLETMLMTMSIYLVLCLLLAGALNHWSARIRAREGRAAR